MKDDTFPRLRFHKHDGSHRRDGDDTISPPKRFSRRLKHYAALKGEAHSSRKATDKVIKTESGKLVEYHQPGSNKANCPKGR